MAVISRRNLEPLTPQPGGDKKRWLPRWPWVRRHLIKSESATGGGVSSPGPPVYCRHVKGVVFLHVEEEGGVRATESLSIEPACTCTGTQIDTYGIDRRSGEIA